MYLNLDVGELETVTAAVEFGLRSDQRTHVVDSLFPNLGYRFRVRAINEFGRGQEASKSSGMMKTIISIQFLLKV